MFASIRSILRDETRGGVRAHKKAVNSILLQTERGIFIRECAGPKLANFLFPLLSNKK